MKANPVTLAIIGAGLTGTSMLCQFVGRLRAVLSQRKDAPPSTEVHVIEKQVVFGPGFPHSDQNALPFHLINMCARDMSIVLDSPDDFQNWVRHHIHEMGKRFPGVSDNEGGPDPECHHYPRAVMGEYLKARFQGAVLEAEKMGVSVHLHPGCEVTDLWEASDNRIRIATMDRGSHKEFVLHADRVLLATGHWFDEIGRNGFFPSPWPPGHLEKNIPEGAAVAIIGTSLSAIDAVLTLTSKGSFCRSSFGELRYQPADRPRHLALYSRTALLPTVRGRIGPYKNQFMVPEKIQDLIHKKGRLSLEDLFDLLDRDLKRAYDRPFAWKDITSPEGTPKSILERHIREARYGDGPHGEIVWQTVLQQTFPMARKLYLALSPADRRRLDREFSTLFFVHAAPMPLINAEKLLALMDSGRVEVRKLIGENPFQITGSSFALTFQGPNGEAIAAAHPYLVDARGQSRFYDRNAQILAENLLKSGTVEIEPSGRKVTYTEKAGAKPHHARSDHGGGRTGGIWIDPHSHRIRRTQSDGSVAVSEGIYAVGAMTRGQIIDASMAHGSAVSTETIAREWVDYLFS